MAATYGSIASDIKTYLVSSIVGLEAQTSSVGDIDYVMDGLIGNSDINLGLIVDFLYSTPHVGDSGRRTTDLWDTYLGGMLILKFDGRTSTETAKENTLNKLWRAFDGGSSKVMKTSAGAVTSISIGEAGTGYTALDVLTITGGGQGDCTVTVDAVGTAGEVTVISITTAGSSYQVKEDYIITGGTGSGCKIDVDTVNANEFIDKVSITRIDQPEKSSVGEFPYYFFPFTMKVNHGGR